MTADRKGSADRQRSVEPEPSVASGPSADEAPPDGGDAGGERPGRPPSDLDLEHELTFRWSDLPAVTAALPGTGGILRHDPDDFQVRELPLYQPSGSGSHRYARVEKVGRTTRELVAALVAAGVPERSVGVAGLKDKVARTEQWISVPRRFEGALDALAGLGGVRVLETSRHGNKLGIGHLRGNRFVVRVREVGADAPERARAVIAALERSGLPNYVGPQRFGRYGRNAVDGLAVLRGARVPGGATLNRFFVAALQSHLFNALLAGRVADGTFGTVLRGDWARKHDTGGTFEVDDPQAEAPRAAALAISATIPLYGTRVGRSRHDAGAREAEVLERLGIAPEDFAGRSGAPRHLRASGRRGDRRLSRLVGVAIEVAAEDAPAGAPGDAPAGEREGRALVLSFDLPRGAYATTVLREVMKVEVDAPSADEPGGG